MPLEDDYGGGQGFHAFAVTCESAWGHCARKERLLEIVGGDVDLAMAVNFHLGEQALDWMERVVPALDGATPLECLKTEAGRRRLKECLWRMP